MGASESRWPEPSAAPMLLTACPIASASVNPAAGLTDAEAMGQAVNSIGAALGSGHLDSLAPMLAPQVAVADETGQQSKLLDQAGALAWLKRRAGRAMKVTAQQ